MSESSLWREVAAQLYYHIHTALGDRTPLDALNRVSRKVLGGKGVSSAPHLSPETCSIMRTTYGPDELSRLHLHHQRAKPAKSDLTPVTVRFGDILYVVDGHNRINKMMSEGVASIPVIEITVR